MTSRHQKLGLAENKRVSREEVISMSHTINTLHVVASLTPASGGPSRTVTQLTDALVQHAGIGVTLLSQSLPDEPIVESKCNQVKRRIISNPSTLMLKTGIPLRQELMHLTKKNISLVHSHGIWLPVNHWATRVAIKMMVPLVIQPRGMLEPWALNHKAWKKRLAMLSFQNRDFGVARIIIATSYAEYRNLRSFGLKQPVAIIPNGIMLDPLQRRKCKKTSQNVRTALFLSRIHPKKGLLNLLEAWAEIAPSDWRLKIAGPDEDGHLLKVMAKAKQLNITSSIDLVGEVDGESKSVTYESADLFVLPTYSENFGVVIAEAMSHCLPVITTKGAPWADLEPFDCGWWVDIGLEPLKIALREAMALTDEERYAMGVRGCEYVRRFRWDKIARQTRDVYQWLLGLGPRPSCVVVD